MSETYTVIMRSEAFTLTRDQIEFDSPNYFTSCFLGDFAESRNRTLTLSRDPDLFRIVLDHLSGYEVLPLHTSVIPSRMSPDLALRNLLVDARFYLLDRLIRRIGLCMSGSGPPPAASPVSYVMLTAQDSHHWSLPVPVSSEAANRMIKKYDLDSHSHLWWDGSSSGIESALREASIQKTYVAEALWTKAGGGGHYSHYLILKLIG